MNVDITFLLPELAMGGRVPDEGLERLARELSVRRIIDVREEPFDREALAPHGIELLHLPTPDHGAVAEALLWRGVLWASEGFERREKTLVMCEHGIGRSALVACCILVSLGYEPCEALALAKSVRAKVSPSPAQLEAFSRWSDAWCRSTGERTPRVAFDALARIAYRDQQQPKAA
jgi:hypothetical protein